MKFFFFLFALSTCLVGILRVSSAQEAWGDDRLSVTRGLTLWLDAAVQPEVVRKLSTKRHPLAEGMELDTWFDASGRQRHLVQRVPAAQPVFRRLGEHAFVRFDGEDDFLSSTSGGASVYEFSFFGIVSPHSNAGEFRAFLGASAFGRNDYLSGFNIDQWGHASTVFEVVNVEGPGFGGMKDLMAQRLSFGEFHLVEVHATLKSIRVVIDDRGPGLTRSRDPQRLSLEELFVGARSYSNIAKPTRVRGFLDGDIAELLLFDRVLSGDELNAVRAYLREKHRGLSEAAGAVAGVRGHFLETVPNPPECHVLVPGFEVERLPVDLPNVNNVLSREDGKLYAVGYGGDIFLLSDTDGDGLEDRSELFFESRGRLVSPIGADLTPPSYTHGRGLFDRRDGSVYFGIGTESYANAYLPDASGRSRYDVRSERGTISSSRRTRERRTGARVHRERERSFASLTSIATLLSRCSRGRRVLGRFASPSIALSMTTRCVGSLIGFASSAASRSRSSGAGSRGAGASSYRSSGTTLGPSTIRTSARCSCAGSRGQRANRSIGSTRSSLSELASASKPVLPRRPDRA